MDANKIGTFIKELRTQKNMTQKELAEAINCTDKAISRWETGRGVPEVSLLIPLSKALNVSVNELLTGERFIPEQKTGEQEENKELIIVPDIISKSDETIVDVITEKEKELRKTTKDTVIFMILCCMQMLIFFVFPKMLLDPVIMIVCGTIANAFLVGLLRTKIKWIFPIFGVFVVVSAMAFTGGAEAMFVFAFTLWWGVGAVVVMLVSMLLSLLVRYIAKGIVNRYAIKLFKKENK